MNSENRSQDYVKISNYNIKNQDFSVLFSD